MRRNPKRQVSESSVYVYCVPLKSQVFRLYLSVGVRFRWINYIPKSGQLPTSNQDRGIPNHVVHGAQNLQFYSLQITTPLKGALRQSAESCYAKNLILSGFRRNICAPSLQHRKSTSPSPLLNRTPFRPDCLDFCLHRTPHGPLATRDSELASVNTSELTQLAMLF